jgi:outer membrane immunogenic protein
MQRVVFGSIALLILAAANPAQATDLPVKAPIAMPVKAPLDPVWDWTGFYVGGNAGYSFGNWSNSGLASTGSPNVDGWLGGLQGGYNWQINRSFVVGLEADIQITGERASENPGVTTVTDVAAGALHTISTTTTNNEWKFPWFGTFRGRVGALLDPTLLIYGTGGLAFGEFKMSSQATTVAQTYRGAVGTTTNPIGGPTTTVGAGFSDSKTKIGWTLGAGFEKKFSQNWSVKLEYLYLDFGTETFLAGTGLDTNVHLRDHVARVGVNYQFRQ